MGILKDFGFMAPHMDTRSKMSGHKFGDEEAERDFEQIPERPWTDKIGIVEVGATLARNITNLIMVSKMGPQAQSVENFDKVFG